MNDKETIELKWACGRFKVALIQELRIRQVLNYLENLLNKFHGR